MVTEESNPSPPASPYPLPLERAVIKLGEVVNSIVLQGAERSSAIPYVRTSLWSQGMIVRMRRAILLPEL